MTAPDPVTCFSAAIQRWEGLYSNNRSDKGNYTPGGKLVGTMRGVTVDAYAAFKGVNPETVTPAQLQFDVTLEVAAEIYQKAYFEAPGISKLAWSPLAEICADFGWGSGPGTGIKHLQRVAGCNDDGAIGPQTIAAVNAVIARVGVEQAVIAYTQNRIAFYESISEPGSSNAIFRAGWLRRANWYLPSNTAWWTLWEGWTPA